MPLTNSQVISRDATGVTFADPQKLSFTTRFKTGRTQKTVQGVKLENVRSEVIINDLNDVSVGTTAVSDTLAVRLIISGSTLSRGRIRQILKNLSEQALTWEQENVFLGFEPKTVPVNGSV